MNLEVRAWEEEISLPTYKTGKPEKNPMFFEKRVYQGSSGAVYPNPIIEKIFDGKTDQLYKAVFLENRYIKMMILPELGGRIHMAFDKIANRHFIYYNEVIKPALVGLCGPWISGGIEFNWPQHHRPSTFEAVDYTISENENGSKTIWTNEIEKMNRTKGMAGFTLYPDKAYIETHVKLFNRTPFPQTFLWWANPALKANDHYQAVFPPDVHAVVDHGRRDVSSFPIATGTYYKVDYSPGTDISRYKNIPVPTSYMVNHSDFDFVGGYNHDEEAGFLHVADHHISPGKKQWTWGYGDFGKAWDKNLTDANGPYVELMAGVYTDNQPDFSWIMPYEEKEFTQYFLPYRSLGMVKNASKDMLLNFIIDGDTAWLKIYCSSFQKQITISLYENKALLYSVKATVETGAVFVDSFKPPKIFHESDFILIVQNDLGEELLRYQPPVNSKSQVPAAAKPPDQPGNIKNTEQLYLTGLHLEQYRHATLNPVVYYKEALRREPGDIRSNNAMGLWYLKRGRFAKSEAYFKKGIETLTGFNGNPYDSEIFYNLGTSLQLQGKDEEAYAAFYKATWSGVAQSASFLALAQMDMRNRVYKKALYHADRCLHLNSGNSKAWLLKALALRKLNFDNEAIEVCKIALTKDVFNLLIYIELYHLHLSINDMDIAEEFLKMALRLARNDAHNFIEYSIDLTGMGMYQEAIDWIALTLNDNNPAPHPLLFYYTAWNHHLAGNSEKAIRVFFQAAEADPDYCFPNRTEDILVLEKSLQYNPIDSRALYYLGCLWYDKKQYKEAIVCWNRSIKINDRFPAVHRNLGIACYNKLHEEEKALYYFEKAFQLDECDARILMELDQLKKRLNRSPEERLSFLVKYMPLVIDRDDLYIEFVTIHNLLGQYQKAFELISIRQFHPWEGGEGKVTSQYKYSLIQMARDCITQFLFEKALDNLSQATAYPVNLGEGKLFQSPQNDVDYWMGVAHEGYGDLEKARVCFEKATLGNSLPSAAFFYNDPQPDIIFYRGMAWEKLGVYEMAIRIFNDLVNYGQTHVNDHCRLDYFAVSLPDLLIFDDDLDKRNKIHCRYMMALGQLGLKNFNAAELLFNTILQLDKAHGGSLMHRSLLPSLTAKADSVSNSY